MTLHNNFSLQQLLSEAPPSTSDLQLVKETEILPDHKNPKPKVQEEGLKSTENAINKMKSESLNLTTPLENQQQQQQPKLHKGIPMVRDSEARSSITADVKASQSPYPSKNQQRKIKKHRQAKKDKARKATEQHNDNPREILDLDFDTLLSYHEKAKVTKNETKGIPTKGKRVVQPDNKKEPPKHNIYDAASERRPVKRSHQSTQRELQTKKQKPNAQRPNINNSKNQNQKGNNQKQKVWVPMKSCIYFTKGFCKDGDKCTFKHDAPPLVKAVKICQFYKTGSCVRGDLCVFSHDLKLEPCRFYHMEGKCDNQNNCPYSHEPLNDDLRARLREMTGPCRFYLFKGYCTSGDNCLFSHEDCTEEEKKKVESNILACRFYHTTGECRSGDDCFYLHDEATPEQINKLKQECNKINQ